MHDTRFRTWPAGDTFFVYPDSKSSIRFEKLREGIQDFEKLRILRDTFTNSNNVKDQMKLQQLDHVLNKFQISSLETDGALDLVLEAKKVINQVSK